MGFSDNKKFWTDFILTYKQQRSLWDSKHKLYSNKDARRDSYVLLAQKCQVLYPDADLKFVKSKIENLRASFRRELRKMNKAKLNNEVYNTSLWYYDLLMFSSSSENNDQDKQDSTTKRRQNSPDCTTISDDDIDVLHTPDIKFCTPKLQVYTDEVTENYENISIENRPSSSKRSRADIEENPTNEQVNNQRQNAYGNNLGFQLDCLDGAQRIYAEKIISSVLFYAKLHKLTEADAFSLSSEKSKKSCQEGQNYSSNNRRNNSIDDTSSSQSSDRTISNPNVIANQEFSAFSVHLNQKLSTYNPRTKSQVEFEISKILYQADMKMLNGNSSESMNWESTTFDSDPLFISYNNMRISK